MLKNVSLPNYFMHALIILQSDVIWFVHH